MDLTLLEMNIIHQTQVIDHSQNQLDQKSDTTKPSIDQEDSESGDLESNPDTEQPPRQ